MESIDIKSLNEKIQQDSAFLELLNATVFVVTDATSVLAAVKRVFKLANLIGVLVGL